MAELPLPPLTYDIAVGRHSCHCVAPFHRCGLIVITGGPGSGKTALLNVAREVVCKHVAMVPEAASIVFGGGFWRRNSLEGRKGAQLAIFHVQRQLENILLKENVAAVGLCDRGVIDGLAYWPNSEESFWAALHTTREAEMLRYDAVIHLRTPSEQMGYNHSNPVRIETAALAAEVDQKILEAWQGHPRRIVVDSSDAFSTKVEKALSLIKGLLPTCCRQHEVPERS